MPRLSLYDTSVLVSWMRTQAFDHPIQKAFDSQRFVVCTVVWMELYAGARGNQDKKDLDRIRTDAESWKLVVSPEPDDFYLVGGMLNFYARRHGAIRPRDHTNDALIAACATRTNAELITLNGIDMLRWQDILKRFRRRLRLKVLKYQ